MSKKSHEFYLERAIEVSKEARESGNTPFGAILVDKEGNIIKEGTTSPYSLYDEDIASFKTGDLYDHHDAEGFITLYGLSTKVRAMKLNNKK